jgi:hypothetical protein
MRRPMKPNQLEDGCDPIISLAPAKGGELDAKGMSMAEDNVSEMVSGICPPFENFNSSCWEEYGEAFQACGETKAPLHDGEGRMLPNFEAITRGCRLLISPGEELCTEWCWQLELLGA